MSSFIVSAFTNNEITYYFKISIAQPKRKSTDGNCRHDFREENGQLKINKK